MATLLGKIVADFRTTLATELAVSGTSATLQSATDSDGVALPAGTYYLTLDKEGSQKEHIVCSLSGTALTSISSVSRQGVVTSGVARKHRIGASVEITDFAHISRMNDLLAGTTDLNASDPLKYDAVATLTPGSNELCTVAYADALTFSGAPNGSTTQKGIFEEATVAEQGTATATGSTGARLIPANANLVKTSSGAGDENKIAVLGANGVFADGFLDATRTWTTIQSFSANNCQITTDADSANDAVRKSFLDSTATTAATTLRFGDSSDGAFAQSAGTTTWNTAGKTIYQFSSFALTGTADIAIGSNLQNEPLLILVDGDLTITSSASPAIDGRGRGGAGATGAISLSAQNGVAGKGIMKVLATGGLGGSAGSDPATFNGGGGGGGASCVTAGSAGGGVGAGTGGGTGLLANATSSSPLTVRQWLGILSCGDGGGAGCGTTSGSRAGGSGGNGGGCIVFLVKGAINITSTVSVAGSVGSNGTNNGSNYYTGGGGGGGGGSIAILYAGALTANTATLTVSGGSGGTPVTGSGSGGSGGAGIALVKAIDASLFNAIMNG